MNQIKRIQTVQITGLNSSYDNKTTGLKHPIEALKQGSYIVPEFKEALLKLNTEITKLNGNLYITDLTRTWELQEKARQEFLSGKKKAYVAAPGASFHQAGRAVDIDIFNLKFKNLNETKWLQKLWDIAKPLGFYPIIKSADIHASEAWHFDFPGSDWKKAYEYINVSDKDSVTYQNVCKACIIDIGEWNLEQDQSRILELNIQSQLYRLGRYEIGELDGYLGSKSIKAITDLLGYYSEDKLHVFQNLCQMK